MSEKLKGVQKWVDRRFPFTSFLEKHITQYPTPKNLNYWWNFGSALGIFFTIQLVTGFWLTMYYKPDANLAFASVEHIMRDVNWGALDVLVVVMPPGTGDIQLSLAQQVPVTGAVIAIFTGDCATGAVISIFRAPLFPPKM